MNDEGRMMNDDLCGAQCEVPTQRVLINIIGNMTH
jgi:hypothetical protein